MNMDNLESMLKELLSEKRFEKAVVLMDNIFQIKEIGEISNGLLFAVLTEENNYNAYIMTDNFSLESDPLFCCEKLKQLYKEFKIFR